MEAIFHHLVFEDPTLHPSSQIKNPGSFVQPLGDTLTRRHLFTVVFFLP